MFLYLKNDRLTKKNQDQWIPIIKSTYPVNISFPESKIVVCDQHFDANSILHLGTKKSLMTGAVPNARLSHILVLFFF